MDRVIYHIDCNGFYAGVECLDDPSLRDVPMAVGGDPKDRSGIILAKNDIAKSYGVKTAETIFQAQHKCPDLVLVPPRFWRYVQVSHQVKELFAQYTDQVESFGLDEAWLDVTGSLRYFGQTPVGLADHIRKQVREEIGVTVSVGVSYNKVFAKLGSDMKKPDATTLITPENYQRKVWPLPARELLFVGRTATQALDRHYLRTIGDVARQERAAMNRMLGKGGDTLWLFANGLDASPVRRIGEEEPVQSVGNGMTFRRDLVGWDEVHAGVISLSDEVASRLRKIGMKCRAIQVVLKNPALRSISRQTVLAQPTYLHKEIADAAMQLIRANWREGAPMRSISVTGIQLMPAHLTHDQYSITDRAHDHQRIRQEKLEDAMEDIRSRHGTQSIAMGFVENEQLGIRQFHREVTGEWKKD